MAKTARNLKKTICGVGINDANYKVNKDGTLCQFYKYWSRMMHRCYGVKTQIQSPSYKNCTVAPEWHSFMNFRAWMMMQDWEGKQLDKDIIQPNNKEYGPKTCCFVTADLNCMFKCQRSNKYGTGIHQREGEKGYNAEFVHRKQHHYIGYFSNLMEAQKERNLYKAKYLETEIIPEIKDDLLIAGIQKHIENLREVKK